MQTSTPHNGDGTLVFLSLCTLFHRFAPKYAGVTAKLNKNLCKGQPQAFDGLAASEIYALVTPNAKLKETPAMDLPHSQGNYKVDTDACDEQTRCFLEQNSLIDELDIRNVHLTAWQANRIPHTISVVL